MADEATTTIEFTEKTWVTGDIITATDLNRLEAAVDALVTAVNSAGE